MPSGEVVVDEPAREGRVGLRRQGHEAGLDVGGQPQPSDELAEVVTDAWLVTAPRRLAAAYLADPGAS